MRRNIVLTTDSYKITHWLQRQSNITKLYLYGEPRVGGKYPEICFFGLQPQIEDNLLQVVTGEMIDEAEERSFKTFGTKEYFNRKAWEKVKELGYLPIKIKAVPEGTKMPINNVAFTLESTEPWFAPMIGHIEDILMWSWYPTTVCTRSMTIKNSIKPYFDKSSDIGDLVLPFAVNDFGLRGAAGYEAAALGGMGHLLHFQGSDNEVAMTALYDYYGCEDRLKSVWATEHSVATTFGLSLDEEKAYLDHQLRNSRPDLIISIVIDSNDSDRFIKEVVADPLIKQAIKNRPGRVVFRPDSGDPKINVIKYLDFLGGIFGYSINGKGYKVLNNNVGLIQGDGMDEVSIPALYSEVTKVGWSAENFVTGSGGGLLQEGITRDTSRWAIKASYGERNGQGFNIQKVTKTDPTKASKPGLLKLHPSMRTFTTMSSANMTQPEFAAYLDALVTVYHNGQFNRDNFTNILERASK